MMRWPAGLLTSLALAIAPLAHAQDDYPNRTVRIIVPFAPGGSTDVVARILADKLGTEMKQGFIVENKPGAGGNIGADAVAKATPDGYTLLMGTTGVLAINKYLYKEMSFDPERDLAPVSYTSLITNILVVNPQVPVKSVAELVALARERPGRIDYGSSGNGSSQHLVAALFATMAGAPLNHVPYKGSDRATQDLIGGQVMVGFVGTPIALPHLKSGRLRALGVSTATRSLQMPDVPTLAEAGVPGFEATIWIGLFAPTGTSPEILTRLQSDISRVLAAPEARAQIASTGVEVSIAGAEEFGAFVRSEHAKWGKVVRDTGATVN